MMKSENDFSCKFCNDESYIYSCLNCHKPAIYDYEYGFVVCDTCFMLGDEQNTHSERCTHCNIDNINLNKPKIGNDLKKIALHYHDIGFNVTCITNKINEYNRYTRNFFKTPNHLWNDLSSRKQDLIEIENLDWENSVGLGTVTKWNNLLVIDIDGCHDKNFLLIILQKLGLPSDYEWVVESGSKNGFHIYILGNKIRECIEDHVVSTFPPKNKFEKYFDKIEFLWETHCVLPPSVHGSANRYAFLNTNIPKNKPKRIDDDIIYEFIEEFLEYNEIVHGINYGSFSHKIVSNEEFISEIGKNDLTKYLLDDIYCIVDIETSGLPKKNNDTIIYPEILQIAWVLTNNKGVLIKKNSYIVKTDFFTNNYNVNFLNIDFETADIVGYPMDEIIQKFVEDLKISDYVVAHNIEFDIDILTHHFMTHYGINPFKQKKLICTMKSTVDYCKIENSYGYKFPKLSELYNKLFNFEISNSHNAEVDIVHTLKCFKKLIKIGII
jgi:DNA polymerase III epsilon subunit-like protein